MVVDGWLVVPGQGATSHVLCATTSLIFCETVVVSRVVVRGAPPIYFPLYFIHPPPPTVMTLPPQKLARTVVKRPRIRSHHGTGRHTHWGLFPSHTPTPDMSSTTIVLPTTEAWVKLWRRLWAAPCPPSSSRRLVPADRGAVGFRLPAKLFMPRWSRLSAV